ncbi:hypothetical protein D3C77_541210 [compost metagenome]
MSVGAPAYKNQAENTHGNSRRLHRQRTSPCDHQGGAKSHFRFVLGHGVRVVRLLPLRLPRSNYRQALLCRGQRDHLIHLRPPRFCRRLCRTPVRRHRVRAARRYDRAQVHLPDHHCDHGRVDCNRRLATQLCHHRCSSADHSDYPAPPARLGPGRRIRRCGNLCSRACPAG